MRSNFEEHFGKRNLFERSNLGGAICEIQFERYIKGSEFLFGQVRLPILFYQTMLCLTSLLDRRNSTESCILSARDFIISGSQSTVESLINTCIIQIRFLLSISVDLDLDSVKFKPMLLNPI